MLIGTFFNLLVRHNCPIYFFLPFIGLFFLTSLVGQDNFFYLKGKVLDISNQDPVPYCHVYNESRRKGKITDTSGVFFIQASVGDTLAFLSMSFLGHTYIVKEADKTRLAQFMLRPRYYEIEEVEFTMPGTYQGFQEKFLEIDPQKNKPMKELPKYNPYIRPKLLDTNYIYSGSFRVWHPVSGFYYKHNKEEQSKRKVRHLQEQQLLQPIVDAKYNKGIVSQATGFVGDTLLNFILYCSFSFNYLYESTQYEILLEVERRKKLFIQHCYGQCIPVTVPKRDKRRRK